MRILVLHHNDADGFGAAYALWELVNSAEHDIMFVPVQYGQDPPDVAGYDRLYILDFSYKRDIMESLAAQMGGKLICIDHHKTAQADLAGLSYCIFDQNFSGAVLTWRHCFPDDTENGIPTILQYVQDRDLWKFELPHSKAVNAFIATLAWDFAIWAQFDLDTAVQAGYAILAFQGAQLRSRMKDVRMLEFGPANQTGGFVFGVNTTPLVDADNIQLVPCVNATENQSELGNQLCEAYPDAPFSVSYADRADGSRSYSLRSIGDFDVSEVATAFGGGGHKNAAGFTLPAPGVI